MVSSRNPQNSLVTNDPKSLPGKGNSKDCSISVSFEQGTSFSGDTTLKNGPGVLGGGFPFFGLGFTVSGFAKGGIGKIGDQVNPQNPKGSWTMDQWVWDYIQSDSGVERNDPKSRRDISLDIAYSATDNNFSWYDHPDGGGSGYFRKSNFVVNVSNGKKYCQVEFHLIQQSTGYEVHWGPGLFH